MHNWTFRFADRDDVHPFQGPSKLVNSLAPVPGLPYIGSVTLSNGAHLGFTGNFFQGYPDVSNTGVTLAASAFTVGKSGNATCSATPTAGNASITLANAGTVGTSVTLVTITTKDGTNTFSMGASCWVGPDGTSSAILQIMFGAKSMLSAAVAPGQTYTGSVTFSGGTQVPFSGTFQ